MVAASVQQDDVNKKQTLLFKFENNLDKI